MAVESWNVEPHISSGEASWAILCGVVMGSGILFPPLFGLGLAMGSVGAIRVHGRETEQNLKNLVNYINRQYRKPNIEGLAKKAIQFFEEPGVVRS